MSGFSPISAAIGGLCIGLASVLLMATTGRIAGISGFVSRLLPPYEDGQFLVRVAFVAGIIAGPAIYAFTSGTPTEVDVTSNVPLLMAAGFLVGLGTVIGSGCTSGHGVCGTARLSVRSIVATLLFLATAMTTVFLMRHVLGVQ
ncbi:hypothetical protein DLM45_08580 [Hyphomicrobium methylovorum]|nr:hypothetical protein [Hyphomicrobium methylovorum]